MAGILARLTRRGAGVVLVVSLLAVALAGGAILALGGHSHHNAFKPPALPTAPAPALAHGVGLPLDAARRTSAVAAPGAAIPLRPLPPVAP
jgi:hypothetical protein